MKLFNKLFVILFICTFFKISAQSKKDVLFTVDKQPVTTKEFLRVFNKNRDIVADENQKTVEEYLELYINYKLKLKQAYSLKLDTMPSYKNELAKYREQLAQPYLTDSKVTKTIVKEAYERMLKEINASHILVRLNPKASSADTLKAFNKISKIRKQIVDGADFSEVAKKYSEDPSAKQNGGNLGYFTVFSMVYPFETATYNTKLGEVSKPFKSNFGYHIVKVNNIRKSRGEVEVAHIMLKNDTTKSDDLKAQIKDLYTKLKQGDKFDFLARKYSDDKSSAPRGGLLPKFPSDRMIPSFAEVAFALEKPNDISKPFKTPYGWHIIRLVKKHPIKSYKEVEPELIKKIERSERALFAGKSITNRLKKTYNITENNDLKNLFLSFDDKKIKANLERVIFTINKVDYNLGELVTYNKKQQKKSLLTVYNNFLDEKIISYYKDNLESSNEEFASTMQEYKDGLLLFDLLQKKVWKKSETDTVGIKKFFANNRDNYKYKKRGDVIIATCTKKEKADLVKKYLEQNKDVTEIKRLVNVKPTIHVLLSQGIIEVNSKKLPKDFDFKEGVSKIYEEGENQFIIVKVSTILEPSLKDFKNAKGLVMNDYQNYLEKEWINRLRANHKVKVKKKVLKRLAKQYNN